MRKYFEILTLLLVLQGCSQAVDVNDVGGTAVVYGEDNRFEASFAADGMEQEWAQATAVFVRKERLSENDEGFAVSGIPYRDFRKASMGKELCRDERFYHQTSVGICTGVLVKENVLLSAAHCVRKTDFCDNLRFVFDFVAEGGVSPETVRADQVKKCKRVIKDVRNADIGEDWALVELEDVVEGRTPVKLSHAQDFNIGDPVMAVTSPAGLPLKISDRAEILHVDEKHIRANVDSYVGSSGGPVFSKLTGELVGILVRGAKDYVIDEQRDCVRTNFLRERQYGETITTVPAFAADIEAL